MATIDTKRISVEMARQGLTYRALADLCGTTRQNLSAIIKRGTCRATSAGKIAKALGIDPSEIMQ